MSDIKAVRMSQEGKMTSGDRLVLEWLSKQTKPMWGGHLEREEALNDRSMMRWLELGWIEQVGSDGYQITEAGRSALSA